MSAVPFPLAFACALLLIAAFIGTLVFVAGWGTTKALAFKALLRDATPDHYQGRKADFDEGGRPW